MYQLYTKRTRFSKAGVLRLRICFLAYMLNEIRNHITIFPSAKKDAKSLSYAFVVEVPFFIF